MKKLSKEDKEKLEIYLKVAHYEIHSSNFHQARDEDFREFTVEQCLNSAMKLLGISPTEPGLFSAGEYKIVKANYGFLREDDKKNDKS
jgi:hypothetical protein